MDLFWSKINNAELSPIYDPWGEDDYPLIAEWLQHNGSALDLIVAASQKTQWYQPVGFAAEDWNGKWSIHNFCFPNGDITWALYARAMLRLHQGETERSWHDMRTIGLLAKLDETNFTPAHTVEDMFPRVIALTTDPRIKAEQRNKIFAELIDMLSSNRSVFDYIDTYARWNALSMVIQVMEGDSSCLDMNIVLRMINEHYDQMVAIGEIEDPAEAQRQAERIDQTVAEYSRISEWDIRLQGIVGSPQSISEIFAKKIIVATDMGWSLDREQQDTFVKEQCSLIAALLDYHDAHDEYPPKLDALVPEYIPALPTSPEGKQLGCEYKGRKFQLYFINK